MGQVFVVWLVVQAIFLSAKIFGTEFMDWKSWGFVLLPTIIAVLFPVFIYIFAVVGSFSAAFVGSAIRTIKHRRTMEYIRKNNVRK